MTQDLRLASWHQAVAERDYGLLGTLLDDDIEFHSPFVLTPKKGREQAFFILINVSDIFEDFSYIREWVDGNNMALEFKANIGDIIVKGIDLIHWNDDGKIDHFEVMIRPLKALTTVGELMTKRLEEMTKS